MQASRYHGIQALRFVAAAMVLVCHATHAKAGAAGVDIFFVISGFILTKTNAGRAPGPFLRDRFTRVFPSYWLALIPWLLLAGVGGQLTASNLAASLTLWPVWGDHATRSILSVGWSLSYELLFYAAMALVLFRRGLLWALIAAYVLAMAGAYATRSALLMFLGSPLILEFAAGVLIARFGSTAARPRAGLVAIALAAMAFGWWYVIGAGDLDSGALFTLYRPERLLFWGVPAALLVWGVVQIEGLVTDRSRPLVFLGDASYSIYLWHLLIMQLVPGVGLLRVVPALLVSVAIYRFVEKPMLRFLRRPKLLLAPAE